jgi:sporulation protein YlmC with PRC-barrel domain
MASPIEDVSALVGKPISDQLGQEVGKVREIYEQDGEPMWVTVESSTGMASNRVVFVPLARLKQENEEFRVPYSSQHLNESPEVNPDDELSEEDDRALRDFYSVDLGDQELRTDNEQSYASRVPEGDGAVKKAKQESKD